MLDGDSRDFVEMFVLVGSRERPVLAAPRVWPDADPKDLGRGRRQRNILGAVPIGEKREIMAMIERDGALHGYNSRYMAPGDSSWGLTDGERPLLAWIMGSSDEEYLSRISNKALAAYARRALPPNNRAQFILDGISGLWGDVTGWSVDSLGMARYALKTDFGHDGVLLTGVEHDLACRRVTQAVFENGDRRPLQHFIFSVNH